MTIRGTTIPPRALGFMGLVAAAIVVVATVLVTRPAGSSDDVASTIACNAVSADFGAPVGCSATGPDDALVDWGDGTQTPIADAGTHLFASLGPTDVSVVARNGDTLASTSVDIELDFALRCETGDIWRVYELTPALNTQVAPYDYVYVGADGSSMYPGDSDYPATVLAASKLEKVSPEEQPRIGLCTVDSVAADTLDGTVTWTVTSEWYDPVVTRTRSLTPGVPGLWEGVQPVELHVELDVLGYQASERRGVFFGGCG